MLKEERMKVLEMLKEGIISVSDAEKLLAAVDGEKITTKKGPFKMLKIEVDSDEGDKVRIQIPVEFARLLKGNKINANLGNYNLDIDSILEMVNTGTVGEIVNVNSDGDRVVIKVE